MGGIIVRLPAVRMVQHLIGAPLPPVLPVRPIIMGRAIPNPPVNRPEGNGVRPREGPLGVCRIVLLPVPHVGAQAPIAEMASAMEAKQPPYVPATVKSPPRAVVPIPVYVSMKRIANLLRATCGAFPKGQAGIPCLFARTIIHVRVAVPLIQNGIALPLPGVKRPVGIGVRPVRGDGVPAA